MTRMFPNNMKQIILNIKAHNKNIPTILIALMIKPASISTLLSLFILLVYDIKKYSCIKWVFLLNRESPISRREMNEKGNLIYLLGC